MIFMPIPRPHSCPDELNIHTNHKPINWYDIFEIFYRLFRPSIYPKGYSQYGDPYWAWREYCLTNKYWI